MRKSNPRGQISLLMLMNLIPVMMLFAFVINIGMLVHAKVNLQNAADSAAYAGAATQARLLNRISHLNYAMWMNYKKFIFKYYVVGNMSLRCFPGQPFASAAERCAVIQPNDSDFNFENRAPSSTSVPEFPSLPSICFHPQDGSNTCALTSQAAQSITQNTVNLPCAFGDAACGALKAQLQKISNLQKWDCSTKASINGSLALSWLFNTDPTGAIPSVKNVNALIKDIGLIPANYLLMARIRTLETYVNSRSIQGLTAQLANALEKSQDLAPIERTVLAYRSAEGSLSTGTNGDTTWGVFQPGSLTMSELLPSSAGSDSGLLRLAPIGLPAFSVMYTFSDKDPLAPVVTADNQTEGCGVKLAEIPIADQLALIGVYKANPGRVYYGVKLTAKAHLLFNPFADDITLTAYSAAAPFGSRIGPYHPDPNIFVQSYTVPNAYLGSPSGNGQSKVIQVPTLPFDNEGNKISKVGLLASYIRYIVPVNTNVINTQAILDAVELAQGPDPFEVGKFNIPLDDLIPGTRAENKLAGTNGYNRYFDPKTNRYNLWAPLVPLDPTKRQGRDVSEEIMSVIQNYTGSTTTNAAGGGGNSGVRVQILNNLQAGLDRYLGSLGSNSPDNTESQNIVGITNPLKLKNEFSRIAFNGQSKISNARDLATSWTNAFDKIGAREGYSVKFVPLASIVQGGGPLNTGNLEGTPPTNQPWPPVPPSSFDPIAARDVLRLFY